MSYLVALYEPPNHLKFKHPCSTGEEITAAVRRICEMIQWDPTEHYENFWQTVGNTEKLDEGEQVAFIDLWDSNLIAALVIGRPGAVIQMAESFGSKLEEDRHRRGPGRDRVQWRAGPG